MSTQRSSSISSGSGTSWSLMFWKQRRHMVAILAFLGFCNVYLLRVNLSVAIVAMTSWYNVTLENGTVIQRREFDWNSETQGFVLSSFFYGYLFTQVLGGYLGARYGCATVYGIGVFSTSLFTLFTPPCARVSVYFLILIRVLEGLFEGVTYPCIHGVWSKWAPVQERASLATLAFSGCFVGTVVAMPLSGIIATELGWAATFYITGVVSMVWCVLWWVLVRNDPADDKHISPEELRYIEDSLGTHIKTKIVHPWKAIITSPAVWAINIAHFCENWGFYTLFTQLPTFMKDTLHFDLERAGFASSLPYLVMGVLMQFAGRLADTLRNKNILLPTTIRKLFTCSAFVNQTVFMMLAGFMTTPGGVITCLVFAVGLGAFSWPGFAVNHLDIAPKHASVTMGFTNTFATLPGIISPIVAGYIVTDKKASQWQTVFTISSLLYLFGAIFYGVFASGELQKWAKDDEHAKKENDVTQSEQIRHDNYL